MSSQSQIDANRANSQKSTGPVTAAGKASSSDNRAYHRLSHQSKFQVLNHEDENGYHELQLDLLKQFNLASPVIADKAEHAIVERMAQHEWMRRRALDMQDWVLNNREILRMDHLKLYMRYESQHERAYNACFNQLLKLRAEKRSIQIGFERQKQVAQQAEERKQRHQITVKARQVEVGCKIVRALRTATNNPEAKKVADELLTLHQAA